MYETDIQNNRSTKKNAHDMMYAAQQERQRVGGGHNSPQTGSMVETNVETEEQFFFHEVLAP